MDESTANRIRKDMAEGQEAAFAALYEVYGERLYRVAHTLLGRTEDAEDAVQEVFIALVRGRARLREVNSLSGYVFAVLRSSASRIRQRRQRELATAVLEQLEDRAEPTDSQAAQRRWLRTVLATLPDEQREIVALKVDGELTFGEIATALGISPNTAASRYRYALEKLRAAAQQAEGDQ